MADTFGALGRIDVAAGARFRSQAWTCSRGETEIARLPYTLPRAAREILPLRRSGTAARTRCAPSPAGMRRPSPRTRFPSARARPSAGIHRVPAIVDLAAMREAMVDLGGDAATTTRNPRRAGLDHRAGGRVRLAHGHVQEHRARVRAEPRALRLPALGPTAFDNFSVVPPNTASSPGQLDISRAWSSARRGRRLFAFPTRSSGPTRTRR